MPTNNNQETPLWLNLKKEYIDDNFESLVAYLKANSATNSKDSFLATTLSLLEDRVKDIVSNIAAVPVYEQRITDNDEFTIRLLAAYLLVSPNSEPAFPVYLALFKLLLKNCQTRYTGKIIGLTEQRLKKKGCTVLGYTWSDVEDFRKDIFIHKIATMMKFYGEQDEDSLYSGKGTAALCSDGLMLMACGSSETAKMVISGSRSLDTLAGCAILTSDKDKLKDSDSGSLDNVERFVRDFIASMKKTTKNNTAAPILEYADGDPAIVEITGITGSNIFVRTVDGRFREINGMLRRDRPNIFYYDIGLFARHLKKGDRLQATVSDAGKGEFMIQDQFTRFCVEDCRNTIGYEEVAARLFRKNPTVLVWISSYGIPIYTRLNDSYQYGDYAYLQIQNYGEGGSYGKIECTILEEYDVEEQDKFDIDEAMEVCIRDFAGSTPEVKNTVQKADKTFDPVVLRLLASIFYIYQLSLHRPSERIRLLANARVMEEIVEDSHQSSFLAFSSNYLRALVKFTSGENISDVNLIPDSSYADETPTLTRLQVLELLKEYGRKEHSDILARCIEEYKDENGMISRLARLIQTSNTLDGILSNSALNVIKREIIKSLSLETENDTDLDSDANRYLGVESSTVEFKTSIVFPPDNNMQADPERQKHNVFRAVCAFLNSSIGGTVYLGVNDMGYVCGLANDFKALGCENIDTYTRKYIQDRLIDEFGLDVMTHIQISPMMDNDVVAIKVDPHPYRIVELDGVAYIRVNNEAREMTDIVRRDVVARKVVRERELATKISALQHAQSRRLCVILHDYSSSNSRSISDRTVEPYNVIPEEGLVVCLDHGDGKCKVFKIQRIGYVETTEQPWTRQSSHQEIKIDAFHNTGQKAFAVSWEMDMIAKNLLVEDYPSTKSCIRKDANDDNKWYFSTEVYNVLGVARFYLGLADHIKITGAPELEEYIAEYRKKFI